MDQKIPYVFALFCAITNSIYCQRTISGQVTSSADHKPVIGAVVLVEKTAIGTTTDIDGRYSLSVPNEAKNLLISYTGMKSKTVLITGTTMDIMLDENEKMLNDVVVTALNIKQEKKALGYSVQTVDNDDLTKGGNPDALSGLSGKVAGLQVTTASGMPGAAVNLQLRGITSISNTNQPLLVIDGMPLDNDQNSTLVSAGQDDAGMSGSINQNRGIDLNPEDIESVTVLKGPAAAALYGSDASNGVIMITTKKGGRKNGKKWSVDIGTAVTFDKVNKLPELQNTFLQGSGNTYDPTATHSWGPNKDTMYWDGLGSAVNNGYDSHGNIVGASNPLAKIPFSPYNNINTFFQTGVTSTNNVSLNGGSDNGSFRVAVTNLYQTGIIPTTDINKTTVTLSGEEKIGKIATVSGSASYINSATDATLSGNNLSSVTFGLYATPINFANRNGISGSYTNPAMYTNLDGTERAYTQGYTAFDNPYFTLNNNTYQSIVNRLWGTVQLVVDPTPWLGLTGRMGLDFYNERHSQVFALESASQPEGEILDDQYTSRIINSDLMATLHHRFFKNLNSSLLLGGNIYSNFTQEVLINGQDLGSQGFQNASNASTTLGSESHNTVLRYAAYGSLNLDWKSQVYFSFTGRNDWISTLPVDNRSYFYPSLSLGWVFTETAKLSANKWFPYGKLRLSWSRVGKGPGEDNPYLIYKYFVQSLVGADAWTSGVQFPFNNLNGFTNSAILNNLNLKPEFTNSYEGGLEMQFMKNLKTFGGFGIDVTYYYTLSTNGIIPAPIAPSTGFQEYISNNGEIQNQGFELMGTITPVRIKNFKWDINLNWSKNISKVLSLGDGLNEYNIGGIGGVGTYAIVGQPYGVIYGGDYLRDAHGNVVVDSRQYLPDGALNPGYGLPLADPNQKVIGNPNPKWIMGLRNTLTYRGISLSLLFDIKHGGDIYDGTEGVLVAYGRAAQTVAERENTSYNAGGVLGTPQANGTVLITNTPNNIRVNMTAIAPNGESIAENWYTGNGGGLGAVSSQFIEDGSYFRLRELALSYALPAKLFKNIFLKGIDVTLIGRNLLLVTKYKGIDPDQSAAGAGSNIMGLEYFNLPGTKSYGFSIKLHF